MGLVSHLNGIRVQLAIMIFNLIRNQPHSLHSNFTTMFTLICKEWLNCGTAKLPVEQKQNKKSDTQL